jgi:crossover junction endodeoxyribonuclease RuvC
MPRNKRVLAFDPGYERLGVAVIEKQKGPGRAGKEVLLHSECVRTPAKLEFAQRLNILGTAAEALIKKWTPDAVALEEVFFEKNVKTAMQVGAVMGMLAYIAAKNNLAVHHYTPLQVKVAVTGYGKGDKRAVALMVPKLIALPPRRRLDDELDAIAVGITCLASLR